MPTWPDGRRRTVLLCLLLVALAAAVYAPVLGHGFLNFDDDIHVFKNALVSGGLTLDGVRRAFGFESPDYWHPLSTLSLMLDTELFGLGNPGGFHAVNLLLHAANAALLFLAFRRMTGRTWPSLFAGALFAAHPMQVEAVAWVTARKDVLSTLFWLLTTLAYARYAERPSAVRYAVTALFFALGLMCKSMLVTLPCALLLLDFWPLGRTPWWSRGEGPAFAKAGPLRLVLEKLPLLAVSAASVGLSLLSFPAFSKVAEDHPLSQRLANAVVSYARYLGRLFWPADISVVFPFPEAVPAWQWLGALALVAGISVLVLRQARSRPHLLVGWLWFLGTLVPTLKLYNLGLWYSIAARFTYVPYIGLYAALCFEAEALAARLSLPKKTLAAAAATIVLALAIAARVNVGYWSDSLTMFSRAIKVTQDNAKANINLALALQDAGRPAEAVARLREAVRISPGDAVPHDLLGQALVQAGRQIEALAAFREALRLDPHSALIRSNLAATLNALGRPAEAVALLEQALAANPGYADARVNLGVSLVRLGRTSEAAQQFAEALRLRPDLPAAAFNLGAALLALNRPAEAVAAFEHARRLAPDNAHIQQALAAAQQQAAGSPARP